MQAGKERAQLHDELVATRADGEAAAAQLSELHGLHEEVSRELAAKVELARRLEGELAAARDAAARVVQVP
jgi:predicted  nucleic acid-binding Zn-ribbon protein